MSQKRYSAWRFVHPELDPGKPGLRLTPRQGIDLVSGDDSVRQSVLLLLSTRPGERVMRPNYGCDLHHLMFSPNDDTIAAIAMRYVRQALIQWEPRIDIVSLNAARNPSEPGALIITLEYQVRTTSSVERVELSLNLAGETV
jgi:phage baseplate assembly protein W